MDRILGLVAQGMGPYEAIKVIGRPRATYEDWRMKHKDWARKVTALRAQRGDHQGAQGLDFINFRKLYFEHDTPPHHLRMIEAVERQEPGSMLLILAWPQAAKSTTMIDRVNYLLGPVDPNRRIAIISEGQDLARKLLGQVKDRMTEEFLFQAYIASFGPFKAPDRELNRPWNADYLTVLQAKNDEKDYCASLDTEILTSRGWLTHDQLEPGDLAYGLESNGTARWTVVEKVNHFPSRPRQMVDMTGRGHSSRTTANHRWLVRHRSRDTGKDTMIWRETAALSSACSIPTAAPCSNLPTESKYTDALVELLAWYWTEGSIHHYSDNNVQIQIGQSHRVNAPYVARIRSALTEVFGPPVKGKRDGSGWGERRAEARGMTIFTVWTQGAKWLEELAPDKRVRPEVISQFTAAQLRLFVETSVDADGWRTRGQTVISQRDAGRLDAFEMAVTLLGLQPSRRFDVGLGMWVVCVYRRGSGFRSSATLVRQVEISDEAVWCPTTETGTWLARRKGTVYFTGNSCESRGAGSTLYGGRFDWIWFDDIQSDRNIEQTDKLLRYIRQTALTRPDLERGFITFTGSRVGPTDIYHKMIEEEVLDQVITIPALDRWVDRDDHFTIRYTKDGKKVRAVPDCPAVPTWDRFSLQRLAEIRQKVGEEIWSRTYMQRSFDSAAQTFTEEMIENVKDRTRIAGPAQIGTNVIASIDPAFDSGRCAFVVVAYDSTRLYVLDALVLTDVTRYEDIYGQMMAWSAQYKPTAWIVEQNNFQRGLPQDDRVKEMERKFNFRTYGHQTNRNKNDSVLGVAMMASAFMADADGMTEISLPWGDDQTAKRIGDLTDELRLWRPRKLGRDLRQDLVMALWMAWLRWERDRRTMRVESKAWNVGGMPVQPTGYRMLSKA